MTFDDCYRKHYEQMFRVSLRFGGGDVGFAEDVTHDVFLALYRHDHRRIENVGGWLYRVTVNASLKRLRHQRFVERVTGLFKAHVDRSVPGADALFERYESAKRLRDALTELPALERLTMSMKLFDDKNQQEIAEALACSKGYVSKLVTRACAKLRDMGFRVDDV